jgi:hypothetical protein
MAFQYIFIAFSCLYYLWFVCETCLYVSRCGVKLMNNECETASKEVAVA